MPEHPGQEQKGDQAGSFSAADIAQSASPKRGECRQEHKRLIDRSQMQPSINRIEYQEGQQRVESLNPADPRDFKHAIQNYFIKPIIVDPPVPKTRERKNISIGESVLSDD